MENESIDPSIFSKMQTSKPYSTYRKTTLGALFVTIINPFNNKPEGFMLYGVPGKDETSFVHCWNEMQDVFLKGANRRLFETGDLLFVSKDAGITDEVKEKTIEQFSDDELRDFLGKRYTAFINAVKEINSEPVLFRLINIAKDMDKSEKIVNALEVRLGEVQLNYADSNSN